MRFGRSDLITCKAIFAVIKQAVWRSCYVTITWRILRDISEDGHQRNDLGSIYRIYHARAQQTILHTIKTRPDALLCVQ